MDAHDIVELTTQGFGQRELWSEWMEKYLVLTSSDDIAEDARPVACDIGKMSEHCQEAETLDKVYGVSVYHSITKVRPRI